MLQPWVLASSKSKCHLRVVIFRRVPCARKNLVAPYCAIPRDYLSDTPPLRAMETLVSQHGQLGAIPPPPFLSVSLFENMRSGGAIPPPQKGYLRDTCATPYENKANGCDTPLCDTISKGYCAIWGGISHWAAKRKNRNSIADRGVPRGSSEKRHLFGLVLLCMGSLNKCHLRAGAKRSCEGTSPVRIELLSTPSKLTRPFWGTDCRRSPQSVSSAQAASLCSAGMECSKVLAG